VTITGSEMQSGVSAPRTKIRSKLNPKKSKYNKKSVANSIYECALVLCIHVSFVFNQQLANCRVTKTGSSMQSGAQETKTEN
jgi:hypothetical protein